MEINKITPLLKKKPWRRIVAEDAEITPMTGAEYYDIPTNVTPGIR